MVIALCVCTPPRVLCAETVESVVYDDVVVVLVSVLWALPLLAEASSAA